ncbi:MAG: tetratricopeptide repeat protein [Archangium sp.]
MRIVCQKCSAAYAIDDKFVTPKGVRAQCPRCRHLQLVKKEDAPAAAAPAPAAPPAAPAGPSPFLFDMAAPPAPAAPASSGSGVHFGQTAPAPNAAPVPNPFDFSAPTSPVGGPFDFSSPPPPAPPFPSKPAAPAPAPAQNPSPFDFSAPAPGGGDANPFDFGAPPPGAPAAPSPFDFSAPAAPAPAQSSPFDFGAPPPPPSAQSNSPFDFSGTGGGLPLADPAPPPPPAARASSPKPVAAPPPPAAPSPAAGVKCRSCGKELVDAFDQALGVCDDCRNRAADPEAGQLEPANVPTAPRASGTRPVFPPVGTPASPPETNVVRTAARGGGGDGPGRNRMIAMVAGAAVLVPAAGLLFWKRPWQTRPPPLVVKNGGPSVRTPDALVQQWRLKYPDLDGRSTSQLAEDGEELLAKDTTQSYRDAEETFEQALVLTPGDDRALAGWVLSVAFGRPGRIDDPTAAAAEAMLMAAEQRSGDLRVFVAHAHLLIARSGNPNDIKVLAERGLSSKDPHIKALAALAIGQTFLSKNPQLAAENFQTALATDPKLKRAYFFQAQLSAIQGKYKEATRSLEKRLELDADQWEAAEELARLLVDVGEPARARKVLEAAKAAAPKSARPRLGLAVLAYQHLGDLAGATSELNAIIEDPELAKPIRVDALLHLGTLQRVQGETDRAAETLDRALDLTPDSVPVRLQKFLVLLDKGVTSSARLELDGLKGKLGDKHLESTLEGRLLIGENRLDEAMQTLASTIESDPRRVDALLLSGAAAARGRKDGKAWELCLRRGTRLDFASRPVGSMTQLYVRPADLLKPAVGSYNALVKQLDEDPSPSLCEGLIAWFSEDYAGADRLFAKVISIDPKNATAYAYRSFHSLRKKDVASASRYAARSVDSLRTDGNAHLSQALSLMASKKPDQAKVSAQAALKFNPQSLAAKVILGAVEASRKNEDEARRTLTSVLLTDGYYRDAKRVLYEHQL